MKNIQISTKNNSLQYLENDVLSVLKIFLDRIYGNKSYFSTYFEICVEKRTFIFSFQYLENDPLNVLKLIVDIIFLKEISF